MANARICDRCGKVTAGWGTKFHLVYTWCILKTEKHGSLHSYDLCADCRKKLDKFMDGAEIEEGRSGDE